MPIREPSFRIGCGRYLQGEGMLTKCGNEIARLGRAPLIIGDSTSLSLTQETVVGSISLSCKKHEIITHNGSCNDERAKELAELCRIGGYDVIVGVGGGVIMDFAKLCAYFAECPVVNLPTSSATCAAYTPLSVRYTPEGRTVGTLHFEHEVNAVIADTTILRAQPIRLLLAGVFDALAKLVEIKHRFREGVTQDFPLGLDYAYYMSKHSYDVLTKETADCIEDMQSGVSGDRVERVIFASIAATGVISGIARGSNQSALAHKFYEITRALFPRESAPFLHGEIVGVGLLLQNIFNGETESNRTLLTLMKAHNMPCGIADLGIPSAPEVFEEYRKRLCASTAIDENRAEQCERLCASLTLLWGGNTL